MIQEDALRVVELEKKITVLEGKLAEIAQGSMAARILASTPGFGLICSTELAGEIGTVERFGSEASLALYLGMCPLANGSRHYPDTQEPQQVNARAKMAMLTAMDRHRKCVPESQQYYEKKRREGKKHNQALRALGRQLTRVIYRMLVQKREYEIRGLQPVEGVPKG